MATAYIHRTTGTAFTSNQKFTASAWIKGVIPPAADRFIFNIGEASGSANSVFFYIANTGDLILYGYNPTLQLITDMRLRDPSAWYHIVLAVDTTQGTPADRNKVYINGVQITSFSSETNFGSSDTLGALASGKIQYIGSDTGGGSSWDGAMSHVQYVDGLQLAPTEFGEVDSTSGIWKIKTSCYATPGNNGYCLKMEDSSNLDLDSSSNAHTFTTVDEISATKDSPSDNFCVWSKNNPQAASLASFLYGATMIITNADSTERSTYGSLANSTGKYYMEALCAAVGGVSYIGVLGTQQQLAADTNFKTQSLGYAYRSSDGEKINNNTGAAYGSTYTTGDYMGMAFDITNGTIWFSKNGVWQNSATIGEIAAGTTTNAAFSGMTIGANQFYAPTVCGHTSQRWKANFGNGVFASTAVTSPGTNASGIGIFEYDVPTGFTAWSTKGFNV